MTENDDMIIENTKSQLYDLYIDIKTFLISSEKEKQNNEKLQEISSSSDLNNIIDHLKNCINILIKEKKNIKSLTNNTSQENTDTFKQFESHIRKMEKDLRFNIKNLFMCKIQKDSLEAKLRGYMGLEEEYEELKEKVKYEGGKFLNNDRKDNEIIILRRENSNLKKEINKIEEKSKDFEKKYNDNEDIIKGLKFKITQLNKQIEDMREEINNMKNMKNVSANIVNENKNEIFNINKNIIEHYNKTIEKNSSEKLRFNNNYNSNGNGSISKISLHIKKDIANFQFNNPNLELAKNNNKALNTIDNGNKLILSTYNKNVIFPIRNNYKSIKKNKSNSVSKMSEENDKKSEFYQKYSTGERNNRNDIRIKKKTLSKINKKIQYPAYKLQFSKNSINNRNGNEKRPFEHSALNIIWSNKKSL
jgi:phage shock protein A